MALRFSAIWSGLRKFRATIAAATAGIAESFGQNRIEEYILEQTLDRFAPRGTNPRAQKDPEGVPWEPLSEQTMERRKYNRNAAQALVDFGTLRDSIEIIDSNTNTPALQSAKGAKARIGVRPGSPAYGYYRLHQRGGFNREGKYVPARPFLGFEPGTPDSLGKLIIGNIANEIRKATQ